MRRLLGSYAVGPLGASFLQNGVIGKFTELADNPTLQAVRRIGTENDQWRSFGCHIVAGVLVVIGCTGLSTQFNCLSLQERNRLHGPKVLLP
jgi:hypothetical protein